MATTLATDSDHLIDIIRRLPMLEELYNDTLHREELEHRLDISSPTYYRYANWLSDNGLLEESSDAVTLTSAGEVITGEISRFETTVLTTLGQSEPDRDLLVDVIGHAPGLEALLDGPRDRRALERQLDVSKTTSYRITRSFEDRGLIEKSRGGYALTDAGEQVWDAVATFATNVQTALRLGPVLGAVHNTGPGLDLEALADATVTTPKHGDVHSPVNRFLTLVAGTDSLRGVNMHAIAPLYIRDIHQRVVDGMKIEAIMMPVVVATYLAELPDEVIEVCQSKNMIAHLHDDPPCSLVIVEDRVGIGVRGRDSRTLPMFVDTDSPSVREWAEAVFESCKADGVRMENFSPWHLRQAMENSSLEVATAIDH